MVARYLDRGSDLRSGSSWLLLSKDGSAGNQLTGIERRTGCPLRARPSRGGALGALSEGQVHSGEKQQGSASCEEGIRG